MKKLPKVQGVKISDPKAKYDAVTGSSGAAGSGNKRRQAQVEIQEEGGKAGILNNNQRLLAINLARDSERNYSVAKSIFKQLRNNVVGSDAKIQVNTNDDFAKEATEWFNKDFFVNCDFRSTEDFSKIARNVVAAKKREGDILVMFDDGSSLNVKPEGTGKIICWDADQLAEVSDGDKKLPAGATQEGGVVRDQYGREIGYIVAKKRGSQQVNFEDASFFRRDPDNEDANSVKLIKSTYRVNQGRGTADMLSSIADLLDCYEMRSKELQSAKVAAALAGTITREEAVEDFDDERFDPTADNSDDSAGATNTLPENQTKPVTYERMENLTGGYFDYLAKGDKLELHDIKRPNVHMAEFLDHVTDAAGAVFGFAHAYSRMKADTSYTAFRGDMILSWVSIYVEQKDLEREFLDWVAVRAIRWAIKTKRITAVAPIGWEKKLSWHLPVMPFVDELKERQGNAAALKNAEKDFSELLGPQWKDKMDALAEQVAYAREKGLDWLGIFEAKSGGTMTGGNEPTLQEEMTPGKQDNGDTEDEQT